MGKFKVGDKVLYVGKEMQEIIGKTGIIVNQDAGEISNRVEFNRGYTRGSGGNEHYRTLRGCC